MRSIWKILLGILAAAGIVALLLAIPHYRAKAALENYRKQLAAKGEKLTIGELIPPLPAGDSNGGPEFLKAAALVMNVNSSPPQMRSIAPGHALVGWAEAVSPNEETTNCWPQFSEATRRNQAALKSIRAALAKPALGFPINYHLGFYALLPHLAPVKGAMVGLAGEAMLALREGDASITMDDLNAEAELVGKYHHEPLLISHLVRASLAHIGIATAWEALHHPGWSNGQLAQLQKSWESFNLLDEVEASLSMERAMGPREFNEARDSFRSFSGSAKVNTSGQAYDDVGQVLANPKEGVPAFLGRYPRYWMWKWRGSYEEEIFAMETWQAGLDAIRLTRTNDALIPALEQFNQTFTNLQKLHAGWERRFAFGTYHGNIISRYLRKIADAEIERRMLVTAIALKRYQLQRGNYPARLQELVPACLSKEPVDLMDGKPLRYRRRDDGTFLLYSVGEDGKDDGGDPTPTESDLAKYKLWFKGRDAVWPAPATPEEVGAYENTILDRWKDQLGQKAPFAISPANPGLSRPPAAANSGTNH